MTFLSYLSSWIPVLVWAGIIFYLSHIPGLNSGFGIWDFILRKAAHMFEYAVLTIFLVRAFVKTLPGRSIHFIFALSAAMSFFYAVSDEFHQSFVPNRGASAMDVLVDTAGILLVALYIRMNKWPKILS